MKSCHEIYAEEINKIALSSYNDKRVADGYTLYLIDIQT